MNWIKVTERLPENGQRCLVISKYYIRQIYIADFYKIRNKRYWDPSMYYARSSEIQNGSLSYLSWNERLLKKVTYWMPIPEEP